MMLLVLITLAMMGGVAYAYWREGVFTACTSCINTFLAGLVAFDFWEPIADQMDGQLGGYEDAFTLVFLFGATLGVLRLASNNLAHTYMDYHPALLCGGGAFFGLVTGYLVAGFLVCVYQTLPWHENFMYFEVRTRQSEGGLGRVLPPDRVWLALMYRAGAYPFAADIDPDVTDPESPFDRYRTFDKYGTYELRYARYRRWNDARKEPMPYTGECDAEIHRKARPPKKRPEG